MYVLLRAGISRGSNSLESPSMWFDFFFLLIVNTFEISSVLLVSTVR